MSDSNPPGATPPEPNDLTIDMGAEPITSSLDGVEVPGYRLLDRLGAGGMGVVYLAEQARPRRHVALKIVRGGPVADELSLRLFQREADTLARLRHPNIAALYEVGRTVTGQHFLTMELAQGPTLGEWLQAQVQSGPASDPDRRVRLAMFRNICEAVHYAHQRGVIHRDLKPSNLIVPKDITASSTSRADTTPRVVILDFGLARMIDADQAAEGESMLSQHGAIRGTLAYMSPEQALGHRDQIDVRSDVYSLGVILYEMLTGKRPYDLENVSLLEAVRIICEQPPRLLAAAWTGSGRPDPDLETIVARALSKDPADRYGSAAALGEDVERYLTQQPILARPPSTMYMLRKLIARRKAPFAAAAAILLLIVLGAVGMGALYLRSERNLGRALTAERTARAEAVTSRRTADFLVDLFDGSSPDRARGETITAREIMDAGARRVEHELAGEPLMQARLMTTIGGVYRKLALYQESDTMISRGLELRRTHLPPNDPAIGTSLTEHGLTLEDLGRFPEAEAAFRSAIAQLRSASPQDTTSLVNSLSSLGWSLNQRGRSSEAVALMDSALALHAAGRNPEDEKMVDLLSQRSTAQMNLGDPKGAQALLRRAQIMARRLDGELSPRVANVLTNLGVAYGMAQHPDSAEVVYREALAIREKIYGPSHPLVGQSLANLGMSLAEQGKLREARPLMERSIAILEAILGPDHPSVAIGLMNLGLANLQLGDNAKAIELFERARAINERALAPDHPKLALVYYHLASARAANHEFATARALLERVVAIDSKVLGPDHPDVADDLEALVAMMRETGASAAANAAEARMNAIRAKAALAAAADSAKH